MHMWYNLMEYVQILITKIFYRERGYVTMGKGKQQQRAAMYNRQSQGYQQNLYKQQMKLRDVKVPKQPDVEKISKVSRWLGIGWFLLAVVLAFVWKPIVIVPMAVVALLYVGGLIIYMKDFEKKFITAYKKMGVDKQVFMKQLRKGGTDAKSLKKIDKKWDKIKVD